MPKNMNRRNIMDNFIINGVKVSEEQYYRIKNRIPVPDEEIDFSDIPKITHEEFVRAIERKRQKQKLKAVS